MKNPARIFALAAGVLFLFFSCGKERDIPGQGENARRFTCTFAAPDTKVSISKAGKTAWEPGDAIMVLGGADGSGRYEVILTAGDISADGKQASITIEGLEPFSGEKGACPYYAQYPANLVPDGPLQGHCRFTTTDSQLLAACSVGDTFVFYNICGVISFRVQGDIDHVVFSGNHGEMLGCEDFQVTLRDEGNGTSVTYDTFPNYSWMPTLESAVTADGRTLNHLFLAGGSYFQEGFTFRFYKGDALVGEASTATPVNIPPGQILILGDITERISSGDAVTDLSADGSANCYIVSASGTYTFPAVKGSSSTSVGSVASAEVLWETWNSAETVTPGSVIAAVSIQDDWITFQTPATLHPGNALIAARDASGTILWSWHIWIPETALSENTYGLASAALMDRNLGALVAAPSGSDGRCFGLFYQWGRKDPFPGMQSLSSTKPMTVAGSTTSFFNQTVSLAGSITDPTGYYMVNDSDWDASPSDDLWGADSGDKTIYDPCPPGYKVPTGSEAGTLFSKLTDLGSWSSKSGWFQVGNPSSTFPYAGYIDDYFTSKYVKVGERALIWSAEGTGVKAYALDVRSDKSPLECSFKTTPKARGGSVRCISSNATTPDPDPEDPVDEEAARLARLGRTPIVAVYFTEYTPSSEFPTLEDVRCFTHINAGHARFVNKTTGDGGLTIADPGTKYMKKLAAYKKDYPELKLLLFIGGWGKNADGFSEMAKDPAKRALFCSECLRLCNELNFDGVDIDWEYPTYSADAGKDGYAGTGADPADTENFTILMKELRKTLGPNRLISYAASDSGKYINNAEVLQWVDYINVMTYSMGNPPYHNSPLYRSSLTKSRSGEESIELFHKQGVPYDRMNYGLAFYGHADGTVYPSSMPYHKIVDALSTGLVDGKSVAGYNYRCWDNVGKNCYLGDANGKMYSSYEDEVSLSYRVAFVKEKGMLGAFAWEYREDAKDGTLRKYVYNAFYPAQ